MRVISGVLNSDGSAQTVSADWQPIDHPQQGRYKIQFTPPFTGVPAVVASQVSAPGTANAYDGNGLNTVEVGGVTKEFASFTTTTNNGSEHDRNFSFIVAG